jgi:hypothetical protein
VVFVYVLSFNFVNTAVHFLCRLDSICHALPGHALLKTGGGRLHRDADGQYIVRNRTSHGFELANHVNYRVSIFKLSIDTSEPAKIEPLLEWLPYMIWPLHLFNRGTQPLDTANN